MQVLITAIEQLLRPAFLLAVLAMFVMIVLIWRRRPADVEIDLTLFLTPQFVVTVLMIALVGFVLFMVFLSDTPASNDVQVMVITAVVVTGLQEIRKYWLNSNAESEGKNETIKTLVNQSTTGTGNGATPTKTDQMNVDAENVNIERKPQ